MFVPAVVISVITICLQFFVSVDGKPHLVTKSVLVYAVGNILLDLVFITLLGWGMKGAVLATAVSQAASILILIPHFRDKTCSFHLVNPFKGFMSILKGNMKQGTPFLVSGICTATCYLISNEIILNALGSDGMFVLSICMQITILLTFVIEGTGESILSIGAVLIGENDIDGLRTLIRKAFRFLNAGVFLFSAFIILFPTSLIHLFGAKSPELIGECIIPIRIFTCGLIFSINSRFLIFLYQLLGRMKASSLFPMLQMIFLLLFLWAGYMIAPELLWVAFPLTYFLLFLIQLLYARVASRKHKGMDRITLIPPVEDNLVFDRSVCYSKDDLDKALIEICDFMESQQVKMPDANKVILCCEELMINLINYGKSRNDKQSFDIHIIRTKDAIKVSIKDDGKPFNPTLKYQETVSLDLTDEDVKQISLTIVNGTCEDINYKYMYGENMVYMNFQI